jgi:4-diphosphocytidyl-2-C-methyl-D-erythritol kinase
VTKITARAKVNLFLHVAGPDGRNYHPLQSLVAFADVGDEVGCDIASADPDCAPILDISGRFAHGLSDGEGNLMLKALRQFERVTVTRLAVRLSLAKNLPVASGLGGGSADAGAVFRLLRDGFAPDMADEVLTAMATSLGADGPMCLWAQSALAEGYGEHLTPVKLPQLPCVLVNPGVACSTAAVYGGFDVIGDFADLAHEADIQPDWLDMRDKDQVIAALQSTRNDLEPAAFVIAPVIREVLAALRAQPQTRLARMSGSGATCFALCDTVEAAQALAQTLESLWPEAWISACVLS